MAWSAPEARYASEGSASDARSEFRAMVDALHDVGLEVVLDVVYNHTAELDEWGPTLSLRGRLSSERCKVFAETRGGPFGNGSAQ